MTATAPTKESKWKRALRRLVGRPTPFWRKRLEDQVETPNPVSDALSAGWDQMATATAIIIMRLVIGAGVLTPLALVVQWIFKSPGFSEYGLADPIGRSLAAVCLNSGRCDLPGLLAGTAFALPMLVVIAFLIAGAFYWHEPVADADEVTEYELLDALGALDERIVHLRADLVLAGVLKLSPEELADIPPSQTPYVLASPELEALLDKIMALPTADQAALAERVSKLALGATR